MDWREWLRKDRESILGRVEGDMVVHESGYRIDRRLIKLGTLGLLLLLVFGLWQLDFALEKQLYVHCPYAEDQDGHYRGNCANPCYQEIGRVECRELLFMEFLEPGFTYGKKPPRWLEFAFVIALLPYALAFLINHFVHNRKWRKPK